MIDFMDISLFPTLLLASHPSTYHPKLIVNYLGKHEGAAKKVVRPREHSICFQKKIKRSKVQQLNHSRASPHLPNPQPPNKEETMTNHKINTHECCAEGAERKAKSTVCVSINLPSSSHALAILRTRV